MDEWKTYMFFFVFVIPIGFVIIGVIIEHKRMKYYWRRVCMGRAWRRAFPAADKDLIRSFLEAFTEAFGFKAKQRLCFAPTDRIMDIYKIAYPPHFSLQSDGCELETFMQTIEDRFHLAPACWREDITLGELFSAMVTAGRRKQE